MGIPSSPRGLGRWCALGLACLILVWLAREPAGPHRIEAPVADESPAFQNGVRGIVYDDWPGDGSHVRVEIARLNDRARSSGPFSLNAARELELANVVLRIAWGDPDEEEDGDISQDEEPLRVDAFEIVSPMRDLAEFAGYRRITRVVAEGISIESRHRDELKLLLAAGRAIIGSGGLELTERVRFRNASGLRIDSNRAIWRDYGSILEFPESYRIRDENGTTIGHAGVFEVSRDGRLTPAEGQRG